ncbi:hypothetical protein VFPBJ_07463 [Purpureocillium lilacinum]|uniref:Uncharacterized protein n=1 Tax=Purpureocillium lilacinum TaxID=33203 RepID=A0A179GHZ8_PURLI|nr:hypothetical protein VFPBJ_07463 [Purpureocillium lilacinum]
MGAGRASATGERITAAGDLGIPGWNHARALRQRPTFNELSPRGRAGAEAGSPPRSKRSSAPDCIDDTVSPLRPASSARVAERVLSLFFMHFVCLYRVASNAIPHAKHEPLPPRGKRPGKSDAVTDQDIRKNGESACAEC